MRDLSAFEQHVNGLDDHGRHFPDWTYPDGRQPAPPVRRYSKLHSGPTRAERAQANYYDNLFFGPAPKPAAKPNDTIETIVLAVFISYIFGLFILASGVL